MCLKIGGTHEVSVDGRRTSYPADSVSLRAPGCVWASDDGVQGFLSIDLAPGAPPRGRAPRLDGASAGAGRCRTSPASRGASCRPRTSWRQARSRPGSSRRSWRSARFESDGLRDAAGPRGAVDDARDFLAAHLDGRPTLEATAGAAGVSTFTLLRRFRRALGTTPHAYLVMLRVARAQQLIAAGTPLAEVAAHAGFADQAHLGRWFRRLLGVTPAALRPAPRPARQFRSRHRAQPLTASSAMTDFLRADPARRVSVGFDERRRAPRRPPLPPARRRRG